MGFVFRDFYRSEYGTMVEFNRPKKKIDQNSTMQTVHDACGLFQKSTYKFDYQKKSPSEEAP